MPRWSRSMPVLAVAGAVAVAGCGGDYPKKADEICKKSAERVHHLTEAKGAGDLHVYFRQAQMILSDQIHELKAIKPPEKKMAAYHRYIGALEKTLAELRRASDTVATDANRALAEITRQRAETSGVRAQEATAAGLKECAKTAA
jgi:hypothetical protein